MAAAARTTVVQVGEVVAAGGIDPEVVVTPGIYVDTVVTVPARPLTRTRKDWTMTTTRHRGRRRSRPTAGR